MMYAKIRDLKKDVLKQYNENWIPLIKANMIPIISAILTGLFIMILVSAVVVLVTVLLQGEMVSGNASQNATTTTNPTSGGNLAFEFLTNAITIFIAVGIQYGTLDWFRDKNTNLSWGTPFQTFKRRYFVSTLAIFIFQFIFRFLWSMLFIIPGLIKYYSYSQAYFLYKDAEKRKKDDQLEFINFITFSRRLMNGNKGRLFLLQLSLLGWYILSILTFGIGFIWLIPYKNGLYTAFYEDLIEKNGKQVVPEIFA